MATTTSLMESSGEHENVQFNFRAVPITESQAAFTFSVIEHHYVSGRRLPYIKPVTRNVPCVHLPLGIFQDASRLQDAICRLLLNVGCFRDPLTSKFMGNQLADFCLQTMQSGSNRSGVRFHTVATLHFGATAADMAITRLERLDVTAAGSSEIGQQGCSICFEDFEEPTDHFELARLPCAHVFHYRCIVPWLSRSQVCPLCRHAV